MRFVFVRHGETQANLEGRLQGHDDTALSQVGEQQVQKLGDRLISEGFSPNYVYTSPLRRAARTAAILSKRWQAQPILKGDLIEHNVGVITGMTRDEIREKYPEIDLDRETSRGLEGVEGVEPLAQRRERAQRIIGCAIESHRDSDTILMVTHGGIIQHIIAELMGTKRTWGISVPNTALFDFEISRDEWTQNDPAFVNTSFWKITRFNDTSHLGHKTGVSTRQKPRQKKSQGRLRPR